MTAEENDRDHECRKMLEEHLEWIEFGRKGDGPKLYSVDWSGKTFQNATFDYAILSQETKFRNSVLRGSSFRHADLRGADFTDADLTSVDFRSAFGLNDECLAGANLVH